MIAWILVGCAVGVDLTLFGVLLVIYRAERRRDRRGM